MKTLEQIVDNHYNEIFNKTLDVIGDDLYDLVVEVKTLDGKTIRVSWLERDKRLKKQL